MSLSRDWRTCHCPGRPVDVYELCIAVWCDRRNTEKEWTLALRGTLYEGDSLCGHEIRGVLIFMMNWFVIIPDKGRIVVVIRIRLKQEVLP